jgi:hypothetical protein
MKAELGRRKENWDAIIKTDFRKIKFVPADEIQEIRYSIHWFPKLCLCQHII